MFVSTFLLYGGLYQITSLNLIPSTKFLNLQQLGLGPDSTNTKAGSMPMEI